MYFQYINDVAINFNGIFMVISQYISMYVNSLCMSLNGIKI
jgi:hypothetical protein